MLGNRNRGNSWLIEMVIWLLLYHWLVLVINIERWLRMVVVVGNGCISPYLLLLLLLPLWVLMWWLHSCTVVVEIHLVSVAIVCIVLVRRRRRRRRKGVIMLLLLLLLSLVHLIWMLIIASIIIHGVMSIVASNRSNLRRSVRRKWSSSRRTEEGMVYGGPSHSESFLRLGGPTFP
jgi:type IV secretory pathway VirB3-like protein